MLQCTVSKPFSTYTSGPWWQYICKTKSLPSTWKSSSCFTLSVADVSTTNIYKAAEPDGLPGRVLRACADQLASVFTDIYTSDTLILNTGTSQGCVLSPLLYSLFTHDSMAKHYSNTIIKFADDTTVVGLITDNDETANREEVKELAVWCQDNNLSLNVSKTKELIVDYRKRRAERAPINIDRAVVERVESFNSLVSISPTNYHGPNTPRQS